ncbi:hypothetical protein Ga0074812_12870 [Parafrankia irregularis]|uniref:MYXO-CTERM domain-containing protein n=2 Tax=Frankiaceae TaxID=74712 RepID=A0A0S4QYG0_9ACTN|nr:hypothetical protein [Parafrankia sp. CH37]CUU59498.1 hypothetical protein Ga0074812_12870 [Parafrankia irregularis]
MRKGMGRSAALLAMSSAASVILTFGPGLTAAHADIFDDKGKCADQKDKDDWDIFGDKDKDHKDDKEARAAVDDKVDGKDGKDFDKDDKFNDKDQGKDDKDDWFADKDDKDRDCAVGAGVIAGGAVGVGVGGAPVGGVGAGGGGAAGGDSSPLLPIAGAGLGALLIGAGMRRRGHGSI